MRPISPDRSRLQNLLHAQSIKSTKSDFYKGLVYYKLNALVDKIKSYNETFNEDESFKAKPRRRKPRKRKSSMEPMLVNDRSTLSKENRKQRKYLPTMKARGSSNFFKRGNFNNGGSEGYRPSPHGLEATHSSTKNVLFEDQKAAVPIPSIKPSALNSMMPVSKDNEGLIKNAFPLESVQGPGGSFRFIDSVEKSPINEALSESSICSEKIGDKRKERVPRSSYQRWKVKYDQNLRVNKIKEQFFKENEDELLHNKSKTRFFDKNRLTRLAQPRKYRKLKIKRNRRRFNISQDVRQDFPEISGIRSKVELKDTIVNAQKAQIFG